jgi:hypothetical protein
VADTESQFAVVEVSAPGCNVHSSEREREREREREHDVRLVYLWGDGCGLLLVGAKMRKRGRKNEVDALLTSHYSVDFKYPCLIGIITNFSIILLLFIILLMRTLASFFFSNQYTWKGLQWGTLALNYN